MHSKSDRPQGCSTMEQRQYRWLFWLTLPLFVFAAVLERLLGRSDADGTPNRSIFSQARATAHSVLPYALMH